MTGTAMATPTIALNATPIPISSHRRVTGFSSLILSSSSAGIRLSRRLLPLAGYPRDKIRHVLIAHRSAARGAAPIGVTKVGPSGNNDRAQRLIADQGQIRAVGYGALFRVLLLHANFMTTCTASAKNILPASNIALPVRLVRRHVQSLENVRLIPVRPNPHNQGIDLVIRQHAPRALRKRRHQRSLYAVANRIPQRPLVDDRFVLRVAERHGWTVRAIRAMAGGAGLRGEAPKVHHLIRAHHFVAGERFARMAARQCQAAKNDHAATESACVHQWRSFPSGGIPDASIPMRRTNGID